MTAERLDFRHRWVPPQGPDLPTLLLLHGTGGDENDLLPLGAALLPGAGMLAPRGKALEHGMPRYFRRLAAGVFDLEDLRFRTHELADFVTDASDVYKFDARHVIAVGYSNGANIAASLLLSHPGVLAGAALFRAQVPFEPQEQPNLPGVPVFLSGSRGDPMIPARETERLGDMLRAAGADVSVHWESGGHALTVGELEAARRWFASRAISPVS
jgi:phospholipase/carboxylesterase/glyoxalase family protein